MKFAASYLRRWYEFDEVRRWSNPRREPPEWFDHRANIFRFSAQRIPYWTERGVYSRELMFSGCRVLDLCCGDGFYPYHFYAETADRVDAVDRDQTALRHARRWHSHPRIAYHDVDIVTDDYPGGDYDVITWDGAIEHFTEDEQRKVIEKCADALRSGGVLCGYTLLTTGPLGHPKHAHEFATAVELADLLRERFPFVVTLETEYPERHNVYFRAAFTESDLGGFRDPAHNAAGTR